MVADHASASSIRRSIRPVRLQVTLWIDADVIEWFRSRTRRGEGYQTKIDHA